MATHSSTLAWKIPQTEKPGKLWSIGTQRVWYKWGDLAYTHTCRMNCRVQDSFTHTWGGLGVNGWKAELSWTVNQSSSRGPQGGHTSNTVNWGLEIVSQETEAWTSRLLLTKPKKLCSVASATFCWTTKAGSDSRGWVAKNLQLSLIYSIPEPQSCFVEWAVGGYHLFHPLILPNVTLNLFLAKTEILPGQQNTSTGNSK